MNKSQLEMTVAIYYSSGQLSNRPLFIYPVAYYNRASRVICARGGDMSEQTPKARRRRQVQYSWTPQAIRALREHMNMTQRELADELQVRQQTISEWETEAHTPHRSMQKTLSMIAERAGFNYEDSLKPQEPAPEEQG